MTNNINIYNGEISTLSKKQYLLRSLYFILVSSFIIPGSIFSLYFLFESPVDILYVLPLCFITTSLGANTACHMYFTHRCFSTKPWFHFLLAFLGTILCQDSIIQWTANHKRHHRHVDIPDKDPHTPWQFGNKKLTAMTLGLLWASIGWKFSRTLTSKSFYSSSLQNDPIIYFFDRYFVFISISFLFFPLFFGFLIGGPLLSLKWFCYFSALRVFIGYFFTQFVVNGLCHIIGSRKFDTRGKSTNLVFIAPLTFGATLHHNHHAFPRALSPAVSGEIDTMQAFYWFFKKTGLIRDLQVPRQEEIDAKKLHRSDNVMSTQSTSSPLPHSGDSR